MLDARRRGRSIDAGDAGAPWDPNAVTLASAALLLFLVLDPIGNIPMFVTALGPVEASRRRRVIVRELLIALAVLVAFLFAGPYLLRLMGISEPSLTVAGGIILFLIALKMVFPTPGGVFAEQLDDEPFIVPLAIPFVAGPSALASVLFITSSDPARWPVWLAALLLAWSASGIILTQAPLLARWLGRRGTVALERLMGMILTAIAVQMFLTGIRTFLSNER